MQTPLYFKGNLRNGEGRAPAPHPGRRGASDCIARDPARLSARSLDQGVGAWPPGEDVLARSADQHVVAVAAAEGVVPRAADQNVGAVAAVRRELDRVGRQAGCVHHVVTGQGIDLQLIVGGLGAGDVHLRRQALDGNAAGVAADHDHVVAAGALDGDGVGGAVAGAAAGGAGQVEVDLGDVGAGQVVYGDGIGAAQGLEVDMLDAVEVNRNVADVAEEADLMAVGGVVDVFVEVGPVELHRFVADLALDHITAVARVPGKDVVAGDAEHDVIAPAPFDHVVAVTTDEDVVAVAAVLGQRDGVGRQARGVYHVVAGQGIDLQLIVGGLGAGDVHLRRQAGHLDPAAVSSDRDGIVAVGAVDDDRVRGAVAGAAARGRRQVDVHLGHVGAGQVVDGDGVGTTQGVDVQRLGAG